jgi:hypothetical protein
MSTDSNKNHPVKKLPTLFTFACGHEQSIEQLIKKKCGKCHHEEQKKQAAARQAKIARKVQARKEAEAAWAKQTGTDERLPPGSYKNLVWNGEVWYGSLYVHLGGLLESGEFKHFYYSASTERECCHELHRLWIEYKKNHPELQTTNEKSVDGNNPSA